MNKKIIFVIGLMLCMIPTSVYAQQFSHYGTDGMIGDAKSTNQGYYDKQISELQQIIDNQQKEISLLQKLVDKKC